MDHPNNEDHTNGHRPLVGFPKKDYDIDTIPGTPECMTLNTLIGDICENAASIATFKGGGRFRHISLCMSTVAYATTPLSIPFLMTAAPGDLTLKAGVTSVAQDDTKLLYAKGEVST